MTKDSGGIREQVSIRGPEFLDVQVLYIQSIVFDELAASFHVFSHQRAENDFSLGDVFQFHR
jgi:hypothetical protein